MTPQGFPTDADAVPSQSVQVNLCANIPQYTYEYGDYGAAKSSQHAYDINVLWSDVADMVKAINTKCPTGESAVTGGAVMGTHNATASYGDQNLYVKRPGAGVRDTHRKTFPAAA